MPTPVASGALNKDYGLYVNRPFYVISNMSARRYLTHAGGNLAIKSKNGPSNPDAQVWIFDEATKTIKSKKNGKVWSIAEKGTSSNMAIQALPNANSKWYQRFMYSSKDNTFINSNQKVMDVSGGQDKENKNVIAWKSHGKINQKWTVKYLDEGAKEPTPFTPVE